MSDKNKCLLVSFYSYDFKNRNENLGLEKLQYSLKDNGFSCDLIYQQVDNFEDMNKLNSVVDEMIKEFDFDIIGTPVYSSNIVYVDEFFKRIKQKKSVVTFSGGFLATTSTSAVLEFMNHIDFILCGSSVKLIVDFVSNINNIETLCKMNNIAYKSKGQVFINQRSFENVVDDLNVFGERDLIRKNKLEVARLQTARGCTARCAFCTECEKWVGRSPEDIILEMSNIIATYNINTFNIVDSSFEDPTPGFGKKRVEHFCELIIQNGLDVFFSIYSRAESYSYDDLALLRLMKKAGLITIFIGIESGNEESLRLFNKRSTVLKNTNTVKMMQQLNINIEAGFIMFHPYETMEQLLQNLEFFKDNLYIADNISSYTNSLYVYPDTPIYEKLKKDMMLQKEYSIANPGAYSYIDERVKKVQLVMQTIDTVPLYRLWEYLQKLYNIITKAEKYGDFCGVDKFKSECDKIKYDLAMFNINLFSKTIYLSNNNDTDVTVQCISNMLADYDVKEKMKCLDRIKNHFIKYNIDKIHLIVRRAT